MISFISSLEIINVVLHKAKSEGQTDSNIFLWIAASVVAAAAAVAAVNPNSIRTLLANGLSTLFIKSKPVHSNGHKILPRHTPDCPILRKWVFDNYILPEELFSKALQSLETCVLVNNNLCRKLFKSL